MPVLAPAGGRGPPECSCLPPAARRPPPADGCDSTPRQLVPSAEGLSLGSCVRKARTCHTYQQNTNFQKSPGRELHIGAWLWLAPPLSLHCCRTAVTGIAVGLAWVLPPHQAAVCFCCCLAACCAAQWPCALGRAWLWLPLGGALACTCLPFLTWLLPAFLVPAYHAPPLLLCRLLLMQYWPACVSVPAASARASAGTCAVPRLRLPPPPGWTLLEALVPDGGLLLALGGLMPAALG